MSKFVDYTGKERVIRSESGRAATAFDEIPIVDLAPFLQPDATEEARSKVVAEVRHACENVGFMYFRGHGLPQRVMDKAFEEAQRYFEQPLESKMEQHYQKSPVFRGFEPERGNVQGDRKERVDSCLLLLYSLCFHSFLRSTGYEPAADPLNPSNEPVEHDATAGSGPNVWPSEDSAAAGLRTAVLQYYGQCLVLGRKLIRLFSLALDLPEDTFDEAFKVPGVLGRILHYPPQDVDSACVGVNQHTDIECFTLLLQGPDLECLEVLNTAGEWITAPPIPGTLVCNIGDMLGRWSNDRFISTVHRVVNRTGQRRYSIPVFFGPNYSTVVKTFPSCLAEGEVSKYEPIKAGEYVWRRLARSRLGVKYDETVKLEEAVAIKAAA